MIEIGHVGTMDGVIGCKGSDEKERHVLLYQHHSCLACYSE